MDELDELLQAVVAPWDEKAWERLRDAYPGAAGLLARAVAQGATEQQVRDFCDKRGYLVGHWLAQAVAHLRREAEAQTAETGPADAARVLAALAAVPVPVPEAEPEAATEAPRRGKRLHG